ncbi:hypothetical protein G647_03532 [Cladophialophora carrionii CBS 160.54]|uniref:Uncharacterized protein n=1 Tax=Cladophialophora carrionii CBS 160.54 TaxID=1279043 RepID=V9DCX6_9EURO|nr:uncharacterized protein G647_03532 [Cladophialophora carrionii CBS 160.54]ETI24163.1 hypothetical protein G647_03532 [Cladophialophora carrionii CBS 160.54]
MTPHDETRRRSVSCYILQNEIAFFGTLSVASAVRDVLLFGDFPLTRERATCERIVVRLLREALQRDDVPAELLIWAIYTQTALHWLRREYAEAELHAKAIRTIAGSRSHSHLEESSTSASTSFPASSSSGNETSTPWTLVSYQEYDHARLAVLDMERADPSIWGPMLYPRHPFAAETCAKLATLPPGLTALCRTGSISYPVINALAKISENIGSANLVSTNGTVADRARTLNTQNRISAAICIRLLQTFSVTLVEQVLLLAISAYCFFRGGEPATWQNADGFVQVGCLRLMSQPIPDTDAKVMLWEGMVLRTAYGFDTPAREYSDLMLRKVWRCRPELFAERYRVVEEFFWDRGLSDILDRIPL